MSESQINEVENAIKDRRLRLADYAEILLDRTRAFEEMINDTAEVVFRNESNRRDIIIKIAAIKTRLYEIGNSLI